MGTHLLSGNIFCGSCGGKMMHTTAGKKYTRKDGTEVMHRYPQYVCYNHNRHKGSCYGRTSYRAHKIDDVIDEIVTEFFARVKKVPISELVNTRHDAEIAARKSRLAAAKRSLTKSEDDLAALKGEMVATIKGESRFTPELLQESITVAEAERAKLTSEVATLEAECAESDALINSLKADGERMLSYAELFASADPDIRKMVVAKLINRVTVYSNKLDIEWNVTAQEFWSGMAETAGEEVA
jgi:hypothetical protein